MGTFYLILAGLGFTMALAGIVMQNNESDMLYCEELGYIASLKDWQAYAIAQTDDKIAKKEIKLMNKSRFIAEMYLIYNWTLREV